MASRCHDFAACLKNSWKWTWWKIHVMCLCSLSPKEHKQNSAISFHLTDFHGYFDWLYCFLCDLLLDIWGYFKCKDLFPLYGLWNNNFNIKAKKYFYVIYWSISHDFSSLFCSCNFYINLGIKQVVYPILILKFFLFKKDIVSFPPQKKKQKKFYSEPYCRVRP